MKLMMLGDDLSEDISGSIHPQGWVPVETKCVGVVVWLGERSIHPQGWVPVETFWCDRLRDRLAYIRSIHPQGWVPVETPERALRE